MIGFVYILKCSNGKYYIGSTNNLDKRLSQHTLGKVSSTKNILPVVLVGVKQFETIKLARQVEYQLKKRKSKKMVE